MQNKNKISNEAKIKMQEALDAYKKDKNSVQEFYPCMQELTQWLKSKAD